MAKFDVDGKEYDTDLISNEAKNAFAAVQFTQMEMQRLQAQLAAMQTANTTYVQALKIALEKGAPQTTSTFSMNSSNDTIKF